MAVTRRVHVVKPRAIFDAQLPASDNGQYAQLYSDPAVTVALDGLTPAERIVGITLCRQDGKDLIYIFTESFGLGPVKRSQRSP